MYILAQNVNYYLGEEGGEVEGATREALLSLVFLLAECLVCLSFFLPPPISFWLLRSYHRNSTIDDLLRG